MKNFKITVFGSQPYDEKYLKAANETDTFKSHHIQLDFQPIPLSESTVPLADGSDAICVFVNDTVDAPVLNALHNAGVKAILLRCAGYNNIDLKEADKLGLFVAHVPAYSPEAVAEFAVTLMMTLNRQTHRAYNRVREGNFALNGLMGFTVSGKTVGLIGTGRIGVCAAKILNGFGCKVLGYDPYQNDSFKKQGTYVELDELLEKSDIISLHAPLMANTKHIINKDTLAKMKDGAMVINTSRGALVSLAPHFYGGNLLTVHPGRHASRHRRTQEQKTWRPSN